MSKKNVAVIFGGCSVEHEVSIVTALQLIENMNREKYNIIPIYISGKGEWFTGKELLDIEIYKDFEYKERMFKKVLVPPVPSIRGVMHYPKKFGIFSNSIFRGVDVVIPAMHGMNGEDGTIQGLLELANIPYVGSGVVGSAVGMDKAIMKSVFKGNNLPILKYATFLRVEWDSDKEKILKSIESELEYPVFVKPANLGSSIGISKAKDREGLERAIETAVYYDRKIIVEQGVESPIEINCSVMGFGNEVEASVCEQPVNWEEFLTFEDKYTRGGKGASKSGMENMERRIPAQIPDDLAEKIKKLSITAFKAMDCRGVARIDFIIDKDGMKPYINEINTIPGSFSFYLWEYSGIKYPELVDKLIDIACKVNDEKNRNVYCYNSDILDKAKEGQKGGAKG
ncbi:MAG: D-alanine--D-alanine ligase family protein [Deltaproteobacteria bacterium]